jgi:hypothetical protein
MNRLEAIVSTLNVARYLLEQEARERANDIPDFATELSDWGSELDDMLAALEIFQASPLSQTPEPGGDDYADRAEWKARR